MFRLEGVTFSYDAVFKRPGRDAEPRGSAVAKPGSPEADGPRPVLKDLDLHIDAGAITAVIGPSGIGKSTLLYLLGLLWDGRLPAGEITYHRGKKDAPIRYSQLVKSRAACARLRLEEFGFALQSSYLLPTLTGVENVAMPLALQGRSVKDRESAARRLIQEVDDGGEFIPCGDLLPGKLSTGQRQRIAMLRAVVHDPRVLFVDEPVSNLDAENAERIFDLLKRWYTGDLGHDDSHPERTLVLVTHDQNRARSFAHRVVHLQRDWRVQTEP